MIKSVLLSYVYKDILLISISKLSLALQVIKYKCLLFSLLYNIICHRS